MASYARIRISGDTATRSRQYGELAREQITFIRDGYAEAYAAKGVSWSDAVAQALAYVPTVEVAFPELLEEIRGIAEGSGLSFEDVMTINCRSEILHAATVRCARTTAPWRAFGECSSFALEDDRSATGTAIVGQNWDWLEALGPGTIVLEVEREDGPNYVSIVEAGLLAKMTMNAHGIAMGINTLVTTLDGTTNGVPFHFFIRKLADAKSLAGALDILASVGRATSGNYLLASADGSVLNLETSPGDARNVTPQISTDGVLLHTNHFIAPVHGGQDLAQVSMSDSFVRLGRMTRSVRNQDGPLDTARLRAALSDHAEHPNSVCCHPDPASDPKSRWKTLASVFMNPAARSISYTEGPPCESEWIDADYSEFLSGK